MVPKIMSWPQVAYALVKNEYTRAVLTDRAWWQWLGIELNSMNQIKIQNWFASIIPIIIK